MQQSTINAIESVVSQTTTPTDLAQTISNLNQGDVLNTAIGTAQVAGGFASSFGTHLPGGPLADAAGLMVGINSLWSQYNGDQQNIPPGSFQASTLLSAASDFAGLAGAAALALAGVAALPVVAVGGTVVVGTAAASVTALALAGAISLAASAALGIAALAADGTINLQPLFDQINAAADELRDALGDAYDQAVSFVLNAFEAAADGISGVVSGLLDTIATTFDFLSDAHSSIVNTVSDFFTLAQQWVLRRDPLTLDLDGDGLEIVGIDPNSPILFDHDADGIKTGTGWIKSDDGFLVLDRNGNGVIDNGRELFGDSTPLANGTLAADGFAALADQDTNADGKVDANDANFANLRVWRDLNQDGISQANELYTLASLGIVAINTAKTENNTTLANGNVIVLHRDVRMPRAQDAQERPDLGTYVKTDGTPGTAGQTGSLGDVDVPTNTTVRQIDTKVPLHHQPRFDSVVEVMKRTA